MTVLTDSNLNYSFGSVYVTDPGSNRKVMQVFCCGSYSPIFDITRAPALHAVGKISGSRLVSGGKIRAGAAALLQPYFNDLQLPSPLPPLPVPPAGTL